MHVQMHVHSQPTLMNHLLDPVRALPALASKQDCALGFGKIPIQILASARAVASSAG